MMMPLLLLFTWLSPFVAALNVSCSVPWEELVSLLTPGALKIHAENVVPLWMDECVPIFQAENFPITLQNGSNYQLIDQQHGLCADILSCAWKYCDWAPMMSFAEMEAMPSPLQTINLNFEPEKISNETWNLPVATVHPETVSDIIASIQFAKEQGIGMSVKVSGHNYVGASTDKDSLLINMRKYPKYAIDYTFTSLLECSSNMTESSSTTYTTNELRFKACKVAMSRNFSAILRVGGGEIWDEAYRAVSIWNGNASQPLYHILGGGAGTVGAAGGYLGGTGLSGTTGMRLFGYAADQVTQMEMVLPSGQHVRFGPTEWTADEQLAWPRTTKVTGWCNMNPGASNETEWQWEECDDSVNFDDLWHAVRGGGNGYGVTTAVEYQLHDYPGQLSYLLMGLPENYTAIATAACGECEEAFTIMAVTWLNFLIDIYWNPSAVNVTEEDSNNCGGPDGGASLSLIFASPSIGFCYGDGADIWIAAWKNRILSDSALQSLLLNANATLEMIEMISNALLPGAFLGLGPWPDYVASTMKGPTPGVPEGRAPDSPKPFSIYNFASDGTLVPIKFLVEQREVSLPWLFGYASAGLGTYVMGGNAARYHDGTTATSKHYREAGFMATIVRGRPEGPDLSRTLLKYFNGAYGTPQANYPGGSEFNHYQSHYLGPLKTNWSEPCPELTTEVTREQREELCIPLMEYIFGTEGLARLESIKAAVDPMHLFNCFGCIGYKESITPTSPTDSPSADLPPTDIPPTTLTSDAVAVFGRVCSIVVGVVSSTLLFS